MSARQITINGLAFDVPQPYAEGHQLNEAEASTLNQTYAENIRNNVAGRIKLFLKNASLEKVEDLTEEQIGKIRADASEYIAAYTFSGAGRGGPRMPADPVGKETFKIAADVVRTKLKAKGMKAADLPEGRFDEFVAKVIEANPAIREEAERRVAAAKAASETLFDFGEAAEQPAPASAE